MKKFFPQSNLVSRLLISWVILICALHCAQAQDRLKPDSSSGIPAESSAATWHFIVSGDSRNCGDVVMPAIAANSSRFRPRFYWHLGDLRAIYKIDEDIAFAAANDGHTLTCEKYHQLAWNDFIDHQIDAFGKLPFYVGIGNHEVIPPKTEDEFKRTFAQWLDQPTLREQRLRDKEPPQPETYYHWVRGGVDFIFLDNAESSFSPQQLRWFHQRLDQARTDPEVKSIVVGMHEALPDSIANSHSMGDKGPESPGSISGTEAYKALADFRDATHKLVYVLASHSHFFMENIFDTPKLTPNHEQPLPGWIVGTAGAVRYALPINSGPNAMTDVYGYLLGTVAADGKIRFAFEEVHESDVPQTVRDRYTNAMIPWCFAHNSQNKEPQAKDITPRCPAPNPETTSSAGSR
jgi:Calcineurin-like phosphoesterase